MVHPNYNLILAIYLAHLLTDFVFQNQRLVSAKHHDARRAYLIHGFTHYISAMAIVAIAAPHRFLTLFFQLIAIVLSRVSGAIPLLSSASHPGCRKRVDRFAASPRLI